VEVLVGLFKRPFSLLELTPSAELEFLESGPTEDLIESTGFGGRDLGAMVRWAPLSKSRWLKVSAGAFQGDAERLDATPAGLMVARATTRPWKSVQLGLDWAWRPGTVYFSGTPLPQLAAGRAVSGDLTFSWKEWEVRGEWLWGQRTDVVSRRYADGSEARTFLGAWGLVHYRFAVGPTWVMPALRAEWLDADREHPVGERLALSGALNLDFTPNVRLQLDFTHTQMVPGTLPIEPPLEVNPYLPDALSDALGAQVQIRL
jgi:hypothetical protein